MTEQRQRILTAACDLYLEVGKDRFSMRKLAKRVGVTAPALYRHYESREHVLAEVVREAYREFTSRLSRALEGRTPLDRFVRAGEAYLDFLRAGGSDDPYTLLHSSQIVCPRATTEFTAPQAQNGRSRSAPSMRSTARRFSSSLRGIGGWPRLLSVGRSFMRCRSSICHSSYE